MAINSSGIFATNSAFSTSSITGSSIATYRTDVPHASYDVVTDTVCGVPARDWSRMMHDEQVYHARKWEERHRWEADRREMRFPTEPKETPVKSNPAGYLSNTKLLLLEI